MELLECALLADSVAVTPRLWFPESPGDSNPFVVISALAARTSRTLFATGVTPLPLRAEAEMLATARTMAELYPRRFVLGVGSGNYAALQAAAVSVERKPLSVVDDFLTAVYSIRAGANGPSGHDRIAVPPVVVAAHNRRMLALGAERADGVLLNVVAQSDFATMSSYLMRCGARSYGMYLLTALGSDDEALGSARYVLAGFMRSPKVRERLRRFDSPHARAAEAVAETSPGDLVALSSLLPYEVVSDFAVFSEAQLRERLTAARAFGFDFVALSTYPVPLLLQDRFPPTPLEGTALPATLEAITVVGKSEAA